MCGILGYFSKEAIGFDRFESGLDKLRERGQDDEGILDLEDNTSFGGSTTPETVRTALDSANKRTSSNKFLGHQRLAITGSESCHQPYQFENLSIVFEGEILNYCELRSQLEEKGYVFETDGDTEVLIKSYKEWGKLAFNRFYGYWTAAIYDHDSEELKLVCDPFAKRPLFYSFEGQTLCFSSSITALFEVTRNEPKENIENSKKFLEHGQEVFGSETFFRDVYRLLPGQIVTYKNGSLRKSTYEVTKTEDASLKELLARNIPEDSKFGISVSGGLDSSSIAALAESKSDKAEYFFVSFPGYPFDETEYVEALEQELGIDANKVEIDIPELIKNLDNFIESQEEPVTSFAGLSQAKLSEKVQNHGLNVLISGSGSDEIFCGYQVHLRAYLIYLIKRGRFLTAARIFLGHKDKMNLSQVRKMFIDLLPDKLATSITSKTDKKIESYHKFESVSHNKIKPVKNLEGAIKRELFEGRGQSYTKSSVKNTANRQIESRPGFLHKEIMFKELEEPQTNINSKNVKQDLLKVFQESLPAKILEKRKIGFIDDISINEDIKESLISEIECSQKKNYELVDVDKLITAIENEKISFNRALRAVSYIRWNDKYF